MPSEHIHILGVCGTFMGGVAALAKQAGFRVTGSDLNVYPPMSTQLEALGIDVVQGWDPSQLEPEPDCVIIGNALSRGNPAVEAVLDRGMNYRSGPQWLAENVLRERWVLAVAGTHGKTTTSSILAWILEYAGMKPGFLIGGVPQNFGETARLGDTPFFVVEADEYDTAFFDKRAKFVHYGARTCILNNLEFDHADIYPDIESIQRQFHHLVRTVPGNGRILVNAADANLAQTLEQGCWTEREGFGESEHHDLRAKALSDDSSEFAVYHRGERVGQVKWPMPGRHNMLNALAALGAARHVGVTFEHGLAALAEFGGIKRRLEVRGVVGGVTVYDDFAHHPTAVQETVQALRKRVGGKRILSVLEPRSNTMRLGVHREALAPSLTGSDQVFFYQPPDVEWGLDEVATEVDAPAEVFRDIGELVAGIAEQADPDDHVLIMSNGGFGNIHARLLDALTDRV